MRYLTVAPAGRSSVRSRTESTLPPIKVWARERATKRQVTFRRNHISRSDVLIHERERLHRLRPSTDVAGAHGYAVEEVDPTRVADVMTPIVFSVSPETPAEEERPVDDYEMPAFLRKQRRMLQ